MALDEMEMEQTEGAYLLAGKLCDMIDIGEGEDDDEGRGDEMLSRQELRNAFAGMPQLHEHSIEEFLYLFQLNHEGQIDKEDFIREARHLGVLSHPIA